jgi:hypothetical protein
MAVNSSSSKGWCIAVVSAILVVVADKDKPDYALLALIPTLLFMALDMYYLSMEKGFRNAYNSFVGKVHSGAIKVDDLYFVKPVGGKMGLLWETMKSFSVWGFYPGLAILVLLARFFVLK